VTPVFDDPTTVALNCCVCEAPSETLAGVSDTVTAGTSVIPALADFVGSAALTAVTVTVCALEMEAGALYKPVFVTVPISGLTDQLTPVLVVPPTVAVNCCAWDAPREMLAGLTVTVTGGARATVPFADWVGSTTLWAVTVTVCAVRTLAGAVYRPVESIVPSVGVIDQLTDTLLLPETCAANCWEPEGLSVTDVGLIATATA
jgi:hypothetical protein